jgi:hypothetical protein
MGSALSLDRNPFVETSPARAAFPPVAPAFPSCNAPAVSERSMEKTSPAGRKIFGIDPEKLPDFLRRRFPANTAKEVARQIGGKPDTVEAWLRGRARPGFVATLTMVGLWPEFLAEVSVSPPGWAVAAARAERAARLEAAIAAQQAELERMRG